MMRAKSEANSFWSMDLGIHWLMAVVGGFLGSFAATGYGNFASAETGNILSMAKDINAGDWLRVLIWVLAFVIFAAGIAAGYQEGKRNTVRRSFLSIIVDVAALFLVTVLPDTVPSLVRVYPLFFASACQWMAFPGAAGFSCSPIFITNNFKQTVLGLLTYRDTREQHSLEQAILYGGTVLSFLGGAVIGVFAVLTLGRLSTLRGSGFLLPRPFWCGSGPYGRRRR